MLKKLKKMALQEIKIFFKLLQKIKFVFLKINL